MTIHLLGLPHTRLDAEKYSGCAFTAKAARWVKILHALNKDVIVYWGGDEMADEWSAKEFVSVLSSEEQDTHFGPWNPNVLPYIEWGEHSPDWAPIIANMERELAKRVQPGDIIALEAGATQQRFVNMFPNTITIEPAVGYEGLATGTFAAFESYAWMHYLYGKYAIGDGRSFDTVIPQFLDKSEFAVGKSKGYALFIGRMSLRKGPHVAAEIASRAGIPLVMAGAGAAYSQAVEAQLQCTDGTLVGEPGAIDYRGAVGPLARKKLLSGASVFICPTIYIEPFGTVHAEALMSGVPVIAPDYGVFTETLTNSADGHRYRMLREAVEGVEWFKRTDDQHTRSSRARRAERFSMERSADAWDRWLRRLETLFGDGWYSA
jgi:glycosyltransferase involved in cell wall biosynthesis